MPFDYGDHDVAIALFAISALTAILCSVLLLRAYRRSGVRLLFWAGISFAALAIESAVLIVNEMVVADLTVLRLLIPLIGLMVLLYGLLWEADSLRSGDHFDGYFPVWNDHRL